MVKQIILSTPNLLHLLFYENPNGQREYKRIQFIIAIIILRKKQNLIELDNRVKLEKAVKRKDKITFVN